MSTVFNFTFVPWFRSVAPYIHKFRHQTFVVGVTGEAIAAGKLQGSDCLSAADAGEVVEKLVQRVAGFEVIVESFQGHTRSDEDRRTAEDFRVRMNDESRVHRSAPSLFKPRV